MRVLAREMITCLNCLLYSVRRLDRYVIVCRIIDLLVNLSCYGFFCDVGKFRRFFCSASLKYKRTAFLPLSAWTVRC